MAEVYQRLSMRALSRAGHMVSGCCNTLRCATSSCAHATHDDCDRAQLVRDLSPVGALENFLVAQLARSAASLQSSSDAASALRDTAARIFTSIALPSIFSDSQETINGIAAAASCDAVDRAERAVSAQSRAFGRTLKLLLELQRRRLKAEPTARATALFDEERWTEQSCLEYLAGWRQRHFVCSTCGSRQAYVVPSRQCLECASCSSQSGLRIGTVMANSPLPLSTWFAAIRLVVSTTNIATTELQHQLGISRAATVRTMANRIRAALLVDDRTALLAGLDHYVSPPEPSVCVPEDGAALKVDCHPHAVIAYTSRTKQVALDARVRSEAHPT